MEFLKEFFKFDDITDEQMRQIILKFTGLDRTEFKNHMTANYHEYV